jgi:DNA polymerase elongation subunit (family B)
MSETYISIKEFEQRYNSNDYEIWDEKSNKWCLFKDSCYYVAPVFPKPEDANFPINLITVYLSKTSEFYTFGLYPLDDTTITKNYYYNPDEKEMLEKFCRWFRKSNIQVLSGWFSSQFDIPYLINRCQKLGVEGTMSPIHKWKTEQKEKYDSKGKMTKVWENKIGGIACLDYMDLYKKFQQEKLESYNLNSVCMHEINEGKLEFDGTINTIWKTDWNKFVEYNIQDVNLIIKLDAKMKYIGLAITMCYESLCPFESIFSSVAVLTGYVMKALHNKNMVVSDKGDFHKEQFDGAYVMANQGFYENIISYDVQSLYPSIIMATNMCATTIVMQDECERRAELEAKGMLIKTPIAGVYYDKSKKGIIAEVTENIFNDRIRFKKLQKECGLKGDKVGEEYYDRMQYIRKIAINSLYGIMSSPYFNFYNINHARVITGFGQTIIKYLANNTNDYLQNHYPKKFGKQPLKLAPCQLIDTDSNYYSVKELQETLEDKRSFLDFALDLDKTVLEPLFKKMLDIFCAKYNIENRIKFQRDKIADAMFIQAKKKYAIRMLAKEHKIYDKPKLAITGIEVVRSDTPSWCREKLLSMIELIMESKDRIKVTEYLTKLKAEFCKQSIEKIASPKGISDFGKYDIQSQNIMKTILEGNCFKPHTPMASRAGINYNAIIKHFNIPNQQVDSGSKIRYYYCTTNNILKQDVIGFIGNCPEYIKNNFKIDFEIQWNKTFQDKIQRFYDVMGWGVINLVKPTLSTFLRKKEK